MEYLGDHTLFASQTALVSRSASRVLRYGVTPAVSGLAGVPPFFILGGGFMPWGSQSFYMPRLSASQAVSLFFSSGLPHAPREQSRQHQLGAAQGLGIADPFADDSSTGRGTVLGRAATKLRSIEVQPLTGGSSLKSIQPASGHRPGGMTRLFFLVRFSSPCLERKTEHDPPAGVGKEKKKSLRKIIVREVGTFPGRPIPNPWAYRPVGVEFKGFGLGSGFL